MSKINILTGVIGSDCHAVGNKIIEKVFNEAGFNVINLGVMVSQDDFIDAAIESNAKAILVSSLYGQGELDCEGLRDKCIERGIENIILYVGGNLVVGKQDFNDVEKRFKKMGFDRVFDSKVDLAEVVEILKKDIKERFGETLD